jgi:hypothetical protein
MSRRISIDEFVAELARMDNRTISLLDAYFHARDTALRKLIGLGELVGPAEADAPPAWSLWHQTVPLRRQPQFVVLMAGLIRREQERRERAAEEAERARRAVITAGDAEALTDAELKAVRMALGATLETPRSRWRLLAVLGELWESDTGIPDWEKWGWIADGSEEALAATSSALEAEARRRGLDEMAGPIGRED